MPAGTPTAYLYNGQPATSDAALYTASGSPKTFASLVAVNTTSGAVTLTLSVHRSLSGEVETICDTLSLPAHSAVTLEYDPAEELGEIVLDPGDALHGLASAGTSITVTAF
jgi:hypothetical protein